MTPFTSAAFIAATGSFLLPVIGREVALFESRLYVFFLLFGIYFLGWAIWRAFLRPRYFSPFRILPHPPDHDTFFPIGQTGKFFYNFSGNIFREWFETIPNDGLIVYRHLFNAEILLPTSPNVLAEVLVSQSYEFTKPSFLRAALTQLLGPSVLVVEGDEHKKQRRSLSPAFAFRHIKDLYNVFWDKGCLSTEAIAQTISSDTQFEGPLGVVNIRDWATRATLDIIGVAGMGHDFDSITDPDSEIVRCYRSIFTPTRGAQLLGLLRIYLPTFVMDRIPIKYNIDMLASRDKIRQVCRELISDKKKKLAQSSRSDKDILSVIIESGAFEDENTIDQLMTFLAAGHETTARALSWAIYVFCQNPAIQTRLREEIHASLPSTTDPTAKPITSAEIDSLPYLNAFCNELLRLYPPVAATSRTATHDTKILDQHIPAGSVIVLPAWAINASTKLWGSDAHVFRPERWLAPGAAQTGGAKSNYQNLTFLHGPRSCIGKAFADAELRCLVATWVGRFEFEFEVEGFELKIPVDDLSSPGEFKAKLTDLGGW